MNAKLTVLNKLQRVDSVTGLDVWYKTELDGEYIKTEISNISGTTVAMGQNYTVLIPFDDRYKPYSDWRALDNKGEYYTMSVGDLIFFNSELPDTIAPNDIAKLKQNYPECEVKSVTEVAYKPGITYQLKVGGV